jgi:adenine phosphoribosyltransferase
MPDTGPAPAPGSLADAFFDLKAHIRAVPDFPKPGILFYDICTLLRDGPAFHAAIQMLAELVRPHKPTALAGIESRGFVLAAPLALELGLGFILLRKPRKLPGATIGYNYALEYGTDRLEIQADAVKKGDRVVLLDDLLATGGTMAAGIRLLKEAGAEVPLAAAMIELTFLNGRAKLEAPFQALAAYDS